MKTWSKQYFSKMFPDSTISSEPKPKNGKQGGHIVKIKSTEIDSSNTTIEVMYKYNRIKTWNFLLTLKKTSKHFFPKKRGRKKIK
jgi:hypothetical protein